MPFDDLDSRIFMPSGRLVARLHSFRFALSVEPHMTCMLAVHGVLRAPTCRTRPLEVFGRLSWERQAVEATYATVWLAVK